MHASDFQTLLYAVDDGVATITLNRPGKLNAFTAQMREIWFLQPRFEQRFGRRPFRLLEQERFRSGYDFLLLRCESGELDAEVGEWWTRFQRAGEAEREEMLLPETSAGKPKRRRSRSGRGRSRTEEAGSPDSAGPVPAGGGAGGD